MYKNYRKLFWGEGGQGNTIVGFINLKTFFLKLNFNLFSQVFLLSWSQINSWAQLPLQVFEIKRSFPPPELLLWQDVIYMPLTSTSVFFPVVGIPTTDLWVQDGKCNQNGGVWPWEPDGGWNKRKRKPEALTDLCLIEF